MVYRGNAMSAQRPGDHSNKHWDGIKWPVVGRGIGELGTRLGKTAADPFQVPQRECDTQSMISIPDRTVRCMIFLFLLGMTNNSCVTLLQ